MHPVSIVIPAFNQCAFCQACVASLRLHTPEPHRLILVDNGSTDGVGDYFDTVEDAVVIHSPRNLGFAGGVNLGLRAAEGPVVILNSDTLLSPGWLAELLGALLAEDDTGLAGPVTNCAAGPQQLDGLVLDTQEAIDALAAARCADTRLGVVQAHRLVGFCLAIRREALDAAGEFDERFGIGNFEDDDYCMRVRRAGYRMVIAERSFVYHHGGRTFAAMGLEGAAYNALLEENRQKYEAKWDLTLPRPGATNNRARALREEATLHLRQGRPQDALRFLKQAIEADPGCAASYRDLAAVLEDLGQAALAQQFRERAAALHPNS
ncbi:MAG: glycosyltransferase [Candidatus Hydrogenedentes bacterium]|nr:glycosyltransferase [Candidatus Hydrogenedentota bacterium]